MKTKIERFEDYLEKHKHMENFYYFLYRTFSDIKYNIKNIYYRVFFKYQPRQVWNFNHYAVETLLPNLRRFVKGKRMGCPADLFDDKAVGDECHKWREELEEILWAFEYYHRTEITGEEENVPYDHKKAIADGKRMQAGFELFGRRLSEFWD